MNLKYGVFFFLVVTAVSCRGKIDNTTNLKIIGPDKVTKVPASSPIRHMMVGLATDKKGIFCSGTKIGKNSILTAAHCFKGSDLKNPAKEIRPRAIISPEETAYAVWNGGQDLTDSAGDLRKYVIGNVVLKKNTKGQIWMIPPKPDLAVVCVASSFPDEMKNLDLASFEGAYEPKALIGRSYTYFGLGANNPDGSGRGVLRKGTGKSQKEVLNNNLEPGDEVWVRDSGGFWQELFNPNRPPVGACAADSGGPVFLSDSGTLAGVLSRGGCGEGEKLGRAQKESISFSSLDRSEGGISWIRDAIKKCSEIPERESK